MKNPILLQIFVAALLLAIGYWLGNFLPWSDQTKLAATALPEVPRAPSLPPPSSSLPPSGGSGLPQMPPPSEQSLAPPTAALPQKIEQSVVAQSLTDFITEYQMSDAQKTAMAAEITRLLSQTLLTIKPGQPPPDPSVMEVERKIHEDRMIEILGSPEMLTEFRRFQGSRELRATLQEWASTLSSSGTDISPALQKQVRTIFIEEQEKAMSAARAAGPGQPGAMTSFSDAQGNSQNAAFDAALKRLEPLLAPAALTSLQETMTAAKGRPRMGGGAPPFPGR
jgi:hypothetical protein